MRRSLMIALAVLTGLSTFAQDSTKRPVLTFEKAITIALENGVLLNQQKNFEQQAQFQKLVGYAQIAPSITAQTGVGRNIGNSFNNKTGEVIQGTLDSYSAGLNANLNLFSGFARINQIRQYTAQLEAQNYFVNRTAQDLISLVATQYINVMLDAELVKINRENWNVLKKTLTQIQAQVDIGMKGPVDGYNQSRLTKDAELAVVQAEVQMISDKALLAQTLLIDSYEDFDTERPNWDINIIGNDKIDLTQLTNQAKELRGDYLRAAYTEKAYRYQTYAARGFMMPSLSASFGYGSAYYYNRGIPKQIPDENGVLVDNPSYPLSFHDQFQKINPQKSYGINLFIPVLQGFQNRALVVQSKVLYHNATITRQQVEFQIRNDVAKAVRTFDALKRAYQVTADKIGYAQAALDLEQQRYELGVTSFVEFNTANAGLVKAQTDKAQAEYRLVLQKIMLSYAGGTLKPEDVTNADAPTK